MSTILKVGAALSAVVVSALVWSGCSTGRKSASALDDPRLNRKVAAEAYSFNARLYTDGKPTTFKLEVYHTDSVLGLYGRGYLGKGALRGRATDDSLDVYFPQSNEYLAERLADLLNGSDCPLPVVGIRLLDIFQTTPDKLDLDSAIEVTVDRGDVSRPTFQLAMKGCNWHITVEYDRHDRIGWRIKYFEFTDGKRYQLWGQRERFKADARVELRRFEAGPAPDARRLRP